MTKKYFEAVAVMVGSLIGVGMFSLPFLLVKAGLPNFLILLVVLTLAQFLVHKIFSIIIIESNGYHHLTGYAAMYLGKKWKHFTLFIRVMGSYGALLAYIIICGIFLNQLLQPLLGGSEFIYSSIIFGLEALIIFFGLGMIAEVELFLTIVLLTIVCLLIFQGLPLWNPANFSGFNWPLLFIPFGAILFSLDGSGSLPLVVKILKKDKKQVNKAVIVGTFLPALVIASFSLMVAGLLGTSVTEDALSGLSLVLGQGIIAVALVFGLVTVVTSFLSIAEGIKQTFWWDYRLPEKLSWFLALFPAYFLYILGLSDLICIISFFGAVAGGFCAFMLLSIYLKIKKKKNIKLLPVFLERSLIVFLFLLFAVGVVYEISNFIFNCL